MKAQEKYNIIKRLDEGHISKSYAAKKKVIRSMV